MGDGAVGGASAIVAYSVVAQGDVSGSERGLAVIAVLLILGSLIYYSGRQYRSPFGPTRMTVEQSVILAAGFGLLYIAGIATPSLGGFISVWGPMWLLLSVGMLVYSHVFSRVKWGGRKR